jgi:hypothetical protein
MLIFACAQKAIAQQNSSRPVYADAGLWNTLNINYKLNRKWGLLFTQEFRIRENYSRLNLFYTNLGVNYALAKNIKLGLVYRHIDKYLEDGSFSFRNRIMFDAGYKFEKSKFTASYRHRLQLEWRDFYSSYFGKSPEVFSRNKFEVSYDITPKLSPNISSEFRIQFTDPRNNDDDDNISRNRTIFGLDYAYSPKVKYGIYYLYQAEFNTVTPQIINIIGLEANVNLNKLLEKSKKKEAKD